MLTIKKQFNGLQTLLLGNKVLLSDATTEDVKAAIAKRRGVRPYKLHAFQKRIFILCLCASLNGCATILGGHVTDHQKVRPAKGEPRRQIRAAAFVADCFTPFYCGLILDFATGAIYKPNK